MKVFQIKAAVKNAKPPIWRRCLIPSGITFSQLSVVLDEIMGRKGREAFQFEFYQRKVQLWEEQEDCRFQKSGRYGFREASETWIDEFMEQEAWFSYTLAGGVSYRCTIEAVRTEEIAYPAIIQQKGSGPDAKNEDMAAVNAVLEEKYSICFGAPAFRRKEEICAQIDEDSYTFYAMKEPAVNYEKCRGISLSEALESYTKEDLRSYAQELQLQKISALNKKELAQQVAGKLLSPEVMCSRLYLLTDRQMELFERIAESNYLVPVALDETADTKTLYDLDFLFWDKEHYLEVPADVKEAYRELNTESFQQIRRQIAWMSKCLDIMIALYGAAPVQVLHQIYSRNQELATDMDTMLDVFAQIPDVMNPCEQIGDRMIHKELVANQMYLRLEENQQGKEYYIPTLEEIDAYAAHGYFPSASGYQALKDFLEQQFALDCVEAEQTVYDVFQQINLGHELQTVLNAFHERGLEAPDQESVQTFLAILMDAYNHTRMVYLRGFMPCELPSAPAPRTGSTTVRNSGQKVYPNDPCPCGSGKKYKKCCGR